MRFLYLAALLVSLAGLVTLDRRFRLAFFAEPVRAALTVAGGVLVFLGWDLLGTSRGIFFVGPGRYQSGWLVAPEVPVEEIAFLGLLIYLTLLCWRALDRRESARAGR